MVWAAIGLAAVVFVIFAGWPLYATYKDDLKSLPVPEVEKRLSSSPDGLSQGEAGKRLARYGPNEIAEKKANPLLKLLTYFCGPVRVLSRE